MGEHDDTGSDGKGGGDEGQGSGAVTPAGPEPVASAASSPPDAGQGDDQAPGAAVSGEASEQPAAPGSSPPPAGEGLSPELIAQALRGAIQRKLAEAGLIASDDGTLTAGGEAAERLREGAKRVALNLMGDLSGQIQRLADRAVRPGGPPGGAALGRELERQAAGEDNVIDLDAARRARGAGPLAEAEQRIAGALRESFNRYLLEHAPPAEDGVPGHVKIDGDFVREHGGRLLASLFGSFASAVLPSSLEVSSVPASAGAAGGDASPPAGTDSDAEASPEASVAAEEPGGEEGAVDGAASPEAVRVVEVKLDLPGLFRDLMPPPPK